MELDIRGKTAWICGATGAIGRAAAHALAAEGVTLALSARSEATLGALATEIDAAVSGSRVLPIPLDITSRDDVDRAAERVVGECGGIDILLNTVALPIFGDFLALQDADWDAVFQAKHFGYMRTMRAVIPHMVAKGSGRIINVSGRGGHQPSSASHFAGSSANAAVNLLTKGLADLYGPRGLRINAVAPGPVASERYNRIVATNQSIADQAADGRRPTNVAGLGQPGEIAAIIVFLASKPSGHLNGIVVQADGGSTAAL
jgi:NAD(P)-dependent dehydrogenase (short-subunit alcohol dehydrogenase family)